MLRIILWKLGFEWAHLKRILRPRSDQKVYYFAFGANLSTRVLAQRRITVYEGFDFVLDNAALRFSQPGFYKHHGYASADTVKGEVTYGKMYLILESDAVRMDYYEGLPFLKEHDKVVCTASGFQYFHYRANKPREGLKPTQEYLDYLVNAYREMPHIPEAYLDSLLKTKVLDEMLPPDQTGTYISDIGRRPVFLHPFLMNYERCCLSLVNSLWNRSLLQWMIRN